MAIHDLAARDRYQFQWWAIASVKSGGGGDDVIREQKSIPAREKASMGLLLTLAPPTEELLDGARPRRGSSRRPYGSDSEARGIFDR